MEEKVFLSKEDLLKGDNLEIKRVDLTRGYVFVREMNGRERNVWEQSVLKKTIVVENKKQVSSYEASLDDFYAKLVVSTLCDANGTLLFSLQEARKVSEKLSAANIQKIVKVAQEINDISEEDKEDLIKNSEAEQEDASNSNSAAISE